MVYVHEMYGGGTSKFPGSHTITHNELENTMNILSPYLLTPWSRVLLEKLTCFQLIKKVPTFYGTRKFITVLTSVRHLSLSWANPIQSPQPLPTSWRSVLILSSHLRLGLPMISLNQVSPPKPCAHLSHPPYLTHPQYIGWAVQIIKLLIMYFSSLYYYPIPLTSKYSPQHPVHKHPQPMFLPQCRRPIFTSIQNNRQNYSSIYLDFKFSDSNLEDKRFFTEW